MTTDEHVETVIIGGGQAGLAVGYHLKSRKARIRHPRRERARRRFLAQAVALASAVLPREVSTGFQAWRFRRRPTRIRRAWRWPTISSRM